MKARADAAAKEIKQEQSNSLPVFQIGWAALQKIAPAVRMLSAEVKVDDPDMPFTFATTPTGEAWQNIPKSKLHFGDFRRNLQEGRGVQRG